MGQKSSGHPVRRKRLSKVLLAGMSLVLASLLSSVNAPGADSPFTQDSGSEFAEESIKLDAPYEPTPMAVVNAMLDMGAVGPNDYLIDLGSGDGRIVITAAKKFGARGFGVDLNSDLARLSSYNARKEGVADRVAFYVEDLFQTDISKADVVTMYLLPDVNIKLRQKLLNELKPGTRVVSHDYHMGEWRPDTITVINIALGDYEDSILYLWIIPAGAAGRWRWTLPMPGGEQSFDMELDQHFQDISGAAVNKKGTWRLFNAGLRGNRVRFSLVSEAENNRMIRQDYDGGISGDVIEGTVKLSGGVKDTELQWRATRINAEGRMSQGSIGSYGP